MNRNLLAAIALAAARPALAHEAPPKAARRIEITVTEKGFQPDRIPVKKGELLDLVVTRNTDETCAKKIVISDAHLKAALPLNKPVTLQLTPGKTGELKYACGMDMVSGVLVVE
jgi:plastocyanin domain-containing protein